MDKEEFWPMSVSSLCLSRKKRGGVYKIIRGEKVKV